MRLTLPGALRAQILAEAQRQHPRECCGLVLGRREGQGAAILALHPARNEAARADRFAIHPEDHFAALRAARAAGLAVIGCYHSHPNGAPAPSAADLAGADEEGFFWLIAAGDALEAFVHGNGGFGAAELAVLP